MKIKKILLSILLAYLSASAQTDTVDNYRPYLMEGGDQISGSWTYARPLGIRDTLHYWLIVIDTSSGVRVYSRRLDLNYNVAFGIRGYGLWVTSRPLGDHWEIFDEKFRRIAQSGLIVLKIIELPRLETKKYY